MAKKTLSDKKAEKIGWDSYLTFGKYSKEKWEAEGKKPKNILEILTIDKPYLKFCYEKELHLKNDVLYWLFHNIKEKEFNEILR